MPAEAGWSVCSGWRRLWSALWVPSCPVDTRHFKRGLAALSSHVVTPRSGVPPFPPVSAGPQPSGKVYLVSDSVLGLLGIKQLALVLVGRLPKLGTPASFQMRSELDSHPRRQSLPHPPMPGPGPGKLDCEFGHNQINVGWSWRPRALAPSPCGSPPVPSSSVTSH